ncbi:GntR family transcriptional regulator [Ammoniphilus sp. 3BR4]|uniref:GntR family transcriptional regulator n=1 Tax=Ammoniphilus sp. 3BR4 TaxID=3158265 RepID=UPI003466BD3A
MIVERKSLYKVIYDDVVEKILSGKYQVGEMLPSENDLETMFDTSRTPVRQALKQLENDGYIYRLQGKGSFVANRRPVGMWTLMTGFRNQYSGSWNKIAARTIERTTLVSPLYAQMLKLPAEEELTYLKRIRYYNGEPVVFLEHYISPNIPSELFGKDGAFISVGQVLKDELNLDLIEVEEEIEATLATEDIAHFLQVSDGTPLLKVTRLSFDQKMTPIDANVYFVRTDKWKYVVQFKT